MTHFINHTPFPALRYDGLDQHDGEFDIVVARITYEMDVRKDGRVTLTPSAEQAPLNYCDAPHDDPVHGSVKYESDLAPYKPHTDVVVNATAFAPHGIAARSFEVSVEVGKKRKTLRIHGPRVWKFGLAGWSLGSSTPVDRLDVRYEHAFGGWYEVDGETFASVDNPVGKGWYPAGYLKRVDALELPAPQIESADKPIKNMQDAITPEGFGFFGRSWRGRIGHAGTYDSAWLEKRHPRPPEDFDFRYWCGAHPSMQIAHPAPADLIPVVLQGLLSASEVPEQRVAFHVPVETLFVFVKTGLGLSATKDMVLDTIVIDMQERKVFCTYRIALADALEAFEIQLRHVAAEDRRRQTALAAATLRDPSSPTFIPLPPSLLRAR